MIAAPVSEPSCDLVGRLHFGQRLDARNSVESGASLP